MKYVIGAAILAILAALLPNEQFVNPALAGSALIDTDWDGCNDAEEVVLGLDPSNFFDFPDIASLAGGAKTQDGRIDAIDAQVIAFRWATAYPEPLYDVYYDHNDGTGSFGPDGIINILDLQTVFGRFGMTCNGVPDLEVSTICDGLEVEALATGVDEFICAAEPIPSDFTVDEIDKQKMIAGVNVTGSTVVVSSLTGMFQLEGQTNPPPESNAGGGAVTVQHPVECETQVCEATLVDEFGIRTFGISCATFTMTSRFKIYAPWAGIFDVQPPIVTSNITAPCSEELLTWGQISGDIPLSAENWTRYTVESGIPTPWGSVILRSWSDEPHTWFDGLFHVNRY